MTTFLIWLAGGFLVVVIVLGIAAAYFDNGRL